MSRVRMGSGWALAGIVLTITAPSAWAQFPQPRLTSLSRAGSRVGEPVETTIRGADLENAERLWFDHPGIASVKVKENVFRVTAAPDVPLGGHDVRVVGRFGVSNPRTWVVGDRPETVETEPNNSPEQANLVAIDQVINGEIHAATEIDFVAFDGRRGMRVFLDLAAERFESRLDATIRVYDPTGVELAESRDSDGLDPFLDLVLPADGRYTVKIHDAIYSGSPEHFYRLTIHTGPHLDAILPAAAAVGSKTRFRLIGRGLGPGADVEPAAGVAGPVYESLEHMLKLEPSELVATAGTAPPRMLVPSSAAIGFSGFELALSRAATLGRANFASRSRFVAATRLPVLVEREPNDVEHPQSITLPCDISGTFHPAGDVDVFRFRAKAGEPWMIAGVAEQGGSFADPSLVIQRVDEKTGKTVDLSRGDDSPDAGAGARFNTQSADPNVRWQPAEDGLYQVEVSDLYGSQRGRPGLTYRLVIRREEPDFALILTPSVIGPDGTLVIRAGGRATASVLAIRREGFRGSIRVEPLALPPGLHAEPVVIGANQQAATVVFQADADARAVVGPVRLVGRSRFGDRKDDLDYIPGASSLGVDLEREALAGGMTSPPNPQAGQFAQARAYHGLVAAILADPAPIVLEALPGRIVAAEGSRVELALAVTRKAGFAEAVAVTCADLPPNVPASSVTIPKNEAKGTLTLVIPRGVPTGVYSFGLRGAGPFPFSKDPNAKSKPNITLTEPSNPIELVVRPSPLGLTLKSTGQVKPGNTLDVDLTLKRLLGASGPVEARLLAPPALKLSCPPIVIPADKDSARLAIKLAADSPVGAAAGVFVSATVILRGEPVTVAEPLALTIAK